MSARQGRERPIAALPPWVPGLLLAALLAQLGSQLLFRPGTPRAEDLPSPPSASTLALPALGEKAAFAKAGMLWLQTFDASGANKTPYQRLDYERLAGWLSALLAEDPRSLYPLFVAARIYAENPDAAKTRRMLRFVHEAFLRDPNLRWPALAHAAILAKHRLADLPLARQYAADLQRLATDPSVPLWARQMEVFVLEDMNELEAARIMLGGLLAAGQIQDPAERRFLEARLKEMEVRLGQSGRPPDSR